MGYSFAIMTTVLFIGGPRDRKIDRISTINQTVEGYHFELACVPHVEGLSGSFTLPVMVSNDKNMDDALVEIENISRIVGWFITEGRVTTHAGPPPRA